MDLIEYVATAEAPEEEAPEKLPGWSDLGGMARKFHYFRDNKFMEPALCNKWAIQRQHELQPDIGGAATSDDCVACTRKLRA